MLIGKRVKEIRLNKKISQQALANKIGVSKVSVCGYESGKRIPSLPVIIKLAEVFDVSVDEMLGRDLKVMAEDTKTYYATIAKEELIFLKELRKNTMLHNKTLKDPERSVKILKYHQTN